MKLHSLKDLKYGWLYRGKDWTSIEFSFENKVLEEIKEGSRRFHVSWAEVDMYKFVEQHQKELIKCGYIIKHDDPHFWLITLDGRPWDL